MTIIETAPPAPANVQPAAWSGWACQYPGKMPRLYGDKEIAEINCDYSNGDQLLFLSSTPPAPAVPDGYCIMPLTLTAANGAKGALSGEFKVSRTVRCHECGGEGCDDCSDAGEFEEEITVPWDTIKDIYRTAVEACRDAMLAQPVSSGYKLPDGWKLVPIDATRAMIDAAQRVEEEGYDAMHKAMLAAAPEGSNDLDT